MNKKILFLSIALIASMTLFAQKQEKIYYDKDWKCCSQTEAEFYRIVNYDENEKPVGKVMDYFITGELQAEIEGALNIDKNNESKSKFIGYSRGYYKSGAKQFEKKYDNQGTIVTSKSWYENGQLRRYREYENGNLNGKTKEWYENGQIKQEIDYKNGEIDGELLTYWENGQIKRIDKYKKGKLITGKCFNINGKKIAYFDFEIYPEFPGGSKKLSQYLAKETKYPEYSRKNGIEGEVLVDFAIDIDGSISDIKIRQSVSEDIDNEAIRVIKKMPKWVPGKEDGVPIKVYFRLPLEFRLR